jgi:MFS transporter, MHS family, proline/betaine transporter
MQPRQAITEEVVAVPGLVAVAAAVIGNGLEWYNFVLYGMFAGVIAKVFFPAVNPLSSLLLSLGTFSVGFFMRPLGGALLGIYSDRRGRRAALSLTILLMCIGTAAIALMPSYAQIGIWAPLLLIFARMLQGFSTGGEMGSAAAFMREYAPRGHTCYYVSWVFASASLFIALGLGFGALVTRDFDSTELQAWGWRVPFLLGLLIGPVGYVLRTRIADPPQHRRTHDDHATPFRDVIHRHPCEALAGIALITLSTICTYVVQVYTPVYAVDTLGLPASAGFVATMVGTVSTGILIPVIGYFGDRVGPRVFLRLAPVLLIIFAWPMFRFINAAPGLASLLVYQLVFGVVIALYQGPLLGGISAMFPDRAMATGLGLSGNIAVSAFGGTAAFVVTWLIAVTGSNDIPAFYLIAGAIAGLIGTLRLRH